MVQNTQDRVNNAKGAISKAQAVAAKRGAKRKQYVIVGRYMDGKEVVGYHLKCISGEDVTADEKRGKKYTRIQVAYLIGRDQVVNCSAQIYKEKLIFTGTNGTSLDSLPIADASGKVRNGDKLGKQRRGGSVEDAMTSYKLTGVIKNKKSVVAYSAIDVTNRTVEIQRAEVIKLARAGRITNARVQLNGGEVLLRGRDGENLGKLPVVREISE